MLQVLFTDLPGVSGRQSGSRVIKLSLNVLFELLLGTRHSEGTEELEVSKNLLPRYLKMVGMDSQNPK